MQKRVPGTRGLEVSAIGSGYMGLDFGYSHLLGRRSVALIPRRWAASPFSTWPKCTVRPVSS